MTWIAEKITNAYPIFSVSDENALLDVLLESVYGYSFPADLSQDEIQKLRRRLLAAAFDLMVAAEYYRAVGHLRWVYCPFPDSEPMAYYPYTSVCPRCVLDGKFYFHQANKPSSGSIGATTSRLLGVFMKALFERHGRVHNGIIENYLDLKHELQRQGHQFVTETDTEIVAHLVEREM
jgi:hypothetical protein